MKIYFYITGNLAAETLMLASDTLRKERADLDVYLMTDGLLPTVSDEHILSTLLTHDFDNQKMGLSRGDLVITGMMWPGNTERKIFNEAQQVGALSIVILPDIAGDAQKFFYNDRLYLPNYICVSDKITYNNLQEIGVPTNIIISIGSLYLDNLFKSCILVNENKKSLCIGYLSVPNRNDFINWGHDYGFNEVEIAEDLIEVGVQLGMNLLIRKHPKELHSKKYDFLQSEQCVVSSHDMASIIDFIEKCDVVVSTYSTSLIVAKRMGRKAICYQPYCKHPFRADIYENIGIPIVKYPELLCDAISESGPILLDNKINDLLYNSNNSNDMFVDFINGVTL